MPNELADVSVAPVAPRIQQMQQAQPAEQSSLDNTAGIPNVFDDLPPDVQAVPVIKMISIGNPPAVLIEPGQYFPSLEPIGKNLPKIVAAGLDFYKSAKGDGVLFNPLLINEAELKKADESGKLEKIIPKYADLTGEQPQEIPDDKFEELLKQQEDNATGLRQLSQQSEKPSAMAPEAPPPPAQAENKIAQARTKNLAPTTPTTRNVPGGGTVLNGLLKRAV